MSDLAPILFFAYNRPDHAEMTLEALSLNTLAPESDLFIFCDGPKTEAVRPMCQAVHTVCDRDWGFRSVTRTYRSENLGVPRSVISSVNELIREYGRVIVFEDDLVTSPHALGYFNRCLDFYQDNPKVFSVTAHNLPEHTARIEGYYDQDVFFCPRNGSWGWATWADRWFCNDWDVPDFQEFISDRDRVKAFSRGGADMPLMLQAQQEGRIGGWDIRFSYTHFKYGASAVYPVRSYVTNIGCDGSGTNCGQASVANDLSLAVPNPRLPEEVQEDERVLADFRKSFNGPLRHGLGRLAKKILPSWAVTRLRALKHSLAR